MTGVAIFSVHNVYVKLDGCDEVTKGEESRLPSCPLADEVTDDACAVFLSLFSCL